MDDDMVEIRKGNIEELIGYHRNDLKEGKLYENLPLFVLRVGPAGSPPDSLPLIPLNPEQAKADSATIDTYINEGLNTGDIIDPKLLEMSLKELLAQNIYQRPEKMLKGELYGKIREMLYGEIESKLLSKEEGIPEVRMEDGKKQIKYALRTSMSQEAKVDLNTLVGNCLSYTYLKSGSGNIGMITIDLVYSTHGEGGI
ncbi:MAG: hypothetical protein AABW92_02335 [Nanoarchaeota archaeon]